MSFFTPPPDASENKSNFLSELLEAVGGAKGISDMLNKLRPKPDASYSAATHTRPLRLPDGTVDPHKYEAVMTVLKGSEYQADIVAEQPLTQEMADAYLAAISDAVASATYEAAFIKHSLEVLKVPVLSLMQQLGRFRKAAAARENKDLILRYRPSASIEGVPSVHVYYQPPDGGPEITMGFWTIKGVTAHVMQLQYALGLVDKHEEFSRTLETDLDITVAEDRHRYIQQVQHAYIEIIDQNSGDLYDLHAAEEK